MWMQEVATKMREKGINGIEWIGQGRIAKQSEIKTLGTEICETRKVNAAFTRVLQ